MVFYLVFPTVNIKNNITLHKNQAVYFFCIHLILSNTGILIG